MPVNSKIRSGIVGIERSIEEQHRATDESITVAFQDLKKLMEKAKEMVTISKTISTKIRVSNTDYFIKVFFTFLTIDILFCLIISAQ